MASLKSSSLYFYFEKKGQSNHRTVYLYSRDLKIAGNLLVTIGNFRQLGPLLVTIGNFRQLGPLLVTIGNFRQLGPLLVTIGNFR